MAVDSSTALAAAVAQARAAWPGVDLPDEAFAAYLGERVDVGDPDALARVHVADLYLACGCACQDERAIAAFMAAFGRDLRAIFADPQVAGVDAEDLGQRVAAHLLAREGDAPPRIAEYAGRGTLRSWLRVVAVRTRLNAERRPGQQHDPLPSAAAARLVDSPDPELDWLKARYREAFRAALAGALAALEPRERNLLRLQVVHGLSATAIAGLHRVHRATAKRWLARVRTRVLETTRDALKHSLRIHTEELDSIMGMIGSRLDASVRHWLDDAEP
jgi:RNA polymerase sigma-70 factor (ECF subfamily)